MIIFTLIPHEIPHAWNMFREVAATSTKKIQRRKDFYMRNPKKTVDDCVILNTETLQQIISDAVEKA